MNMAPMLGRQKWRICSSQPTPREAKLLAPKPPSLFAEPQEKNPPNARSHALSDSIFSQCYPPYFLWTYYYIIFFLGLGHL